VQPAASLSDLHDAVPHRQHYNVTLAVLVAAGVSYALMQSLVLPALPEIQRELHASPTSISWMLTAYLLSASVATPIVGRLGDMHGKQRLLVIVLVVLSFGTLLSALATSMGVMIAGRVIQGAGGGIFPLAFGIIRDEFPRPRVSHGIGLMSSLLGIGGGLGVILAGPIVEHLSYHWLFWLPLAVIAVTMVATYFYVPESPVKVPGTVNWLAAVLLSAGLVVLLVAISRATEWGWGDVRTLAGIAGGLAILAAWVTVEIRSRVPLVDMRMMRIHGVWTTNLVAFLVGMGMYSAFILLPEYVQEPKSTGYGFGATVLVAGVFLIPSTVTQILVGQFVGRIERRVGSKLPLLAGAAITGASFLLLVIARSRPWEMYVSSALLGLGIGLAFAALANLIVEHVRQDQTGVATGMNTVMRTLGGAIGGQLAATILAGNLGLGGQPTSHGYGLAFAMCAGALALAVAIGTLIPRHAPRHLEQAAGRRAHARAA
jgi:EmrB/QacA subfamily drug resistance transporter